MWQDAAYDILKDPEKREVHDADIREREENGGVNRRDRGGGYRDDEDFHFSEKPRPSGLGVPYEGPRTRMETHSCRSDGAHGVDGCPGTPGFSGRGYGGHGQDGTNAGPATTGKHAQEMKIHMRMTVAPGGFFEVDIHHIRSGCELVDPTRDSMRSIPLKAFGVLEWSARGGKGGNGGAGGDGGPGMMGYPGRDATRYSCGTNGGPGGNGGDGGLGTHGADGGRGGDVELLLNRDDAYLLMRVEGCHPRHGVGSLVSGGVGGTAGRHGEGGRGGPGGRGGSSYSWTETRYESRYDSYTKSYRSQPVTVYKSNPGGWPGPSGRKGRTPTSVLRRGADGASGTFVIKLEGPDGIEQSYSARYDLEFESVVAEQLSDMKEPKTFEFGETVMITKVQVKNTGMMETPKQRVLIRFGSVDYISCDSTTRIFLQEGAHVAPGVTAFASDGFLTFDCPYPKNVHDVETKEMKSVADVTDFDPLEKKPSFHYQAHQLGHENRTNDITQISDFQARFTDFQSNGDIMTISYPVENLDGVRGFRSLGPLETSILEFTVKNLSNQEFGSCSKTGRQLFVQLYYADDRSYEIPIEKVRIRAEEGKVVNVQPSMTEKGKGYRYNIDSLRGGGDFTVQLSFKLHDKSIQVSEKAGLQVDLYLQKISRLLPEGGYEEQAKKQLAQRRLFVVSCQPRFRPHLDCDVILVTTTGSIASQVSAWLSLLSELGFRAQPYSMSRYGHMGPQEIVEGLGLKDAFTNKLVIILNDDYVPVPNVSAAERRKCRPSLLLKSVYEHNESTKFLIVGGTTDPVRHLSPVSAALNTEGIENKSHCNIKACREQVLEERNLLRSNGFDLGRTKPASFDICVKVKRFGKPKASTMSKIMKSKAEKTTRWLRKIDPLRPYSVAWTTLPESTVVREGSPSTWKVGSLTVLVGPPCCQNTVSFIEEFAAATSGRLTVPETIRSPSMIFAILQASSFQAKMACFCRNAETAAEYSDSAPFCERILQVVKDCLVGEFVVEVTNYYHGRLRVKEDRNHFQPEHSLS